jgi:two-component system, NarL family, response regulator DevR
MSLLSEEPPRPLSIFIVDASPIVRRTLAELLLLLPHVEICGEADSVEGALAGLCRCQADVVLLDLNLKGGSGVDVMGGIHVSLPNTVVIVVSIHPFHEMGAKALAAGADFYFEKTGNLDLLLETLLAIGRSKHPATFANVRPERFVSSEQRLDQQKSRARRDLDRDALERVPDCVKILDANGKVLWINSNSRRLFEVDGIDAFPRGGWGELFEEAYRPLAAAALDSARLFGHARFSAPCVTAKGNRKWWEIAISSMMNEQLRPDKFLIVGREITEQVDAAARLDLVAEDRARRRSSHG